MVLAIPHDQVRRRPHSMRQRVEVNVHEGGQGGEHLRAAGKARRAIAVLAASVAVLSYPKRRKALPS